ncbi:MAG: GNAT family N-acetyltransferase [Nevskia sp.]|nr:GNAT family N-acetyltransferase [Nevskia sp.]
MRATESFRIEPLSSVHDRSGFSSGSAPLDRYFREQASQDVKRRIATCFVAVNAQTGEVGGFYTLAATSIVLDALTPDIAKKLPRYPVVPAALLGRLAVSGRCQGKGLGSALLGDALIRTSRTEIGVFVMLVDAKDDAAQRFYERYGFSLLPGEVRRLSLPIATALRQLATMHVPTKRP